MTDMPTESDAISAQPPLSGGAAVFFDGASNRRRAVTLRFANRLEISDDERRLLGIWAYADIRRADSPSGTLRLSCVNAPALARLEIRDAAVAAGLVARCDRVDENNPGRRGERRCAG